MCDCLVALPAATGSATLFAKNSDRPPGEQQVIEVSSAHRDPPGLRVTHVEVEGFGDDTVPCLISRPAWGWGAEQGVNAAGVAVGNEAIYTTLDPRPFPPALTGMDLVRLALERAVTAAGAVEVIVGLLQRYGQGGSGHDPALVPEGRPYWSSFLVADPADAWVVETSGREWAAEQVPAEPGVRAISNRTTIPAFDAEHRHPRQPVDRLVDPRWHASQAVLDRRPVTFDALAAHLRSHDSCGDAGWSVCMHVPGVEETTASMIAELRVRGGHRVWTLLGHPCEQEYVEHVVG